MRLNVNAGRQCVRHLRELRWVLQVLHADFDRRVDETADLELKRIFFDIRDAAVIAYTGFVR